MPKGVFTGSNKLGPYSRVLRRGILRNSLDGRSTMGRFCRDLELQLIEHLGGRPTITQRLMIDRLIRTTVQLNQLDDKLLEGRCSELDCRTYNGLVNRQRLLARELGFEAPNGRTMPQKAGVDPAPRASVSDRADGATRRALNELLKQRQAEEAAS